MKSARTFRSGPYVHGLFSAAERVDAYLQAQICARIRQARIEAGFTQEEIADLLHMTMRGYQNYEKDRVPWRALDKIAELTNVTQEWLLRGGPDEATAGPPSLSNHELVEKIERVEQAVESLRQEILEALQAEPSQQRAAR
jgi:transcriptional regulator with XRE-family HTH domain